VVSFLRWNFLVDSFTLVGGCPGRGILWIVVRT
jgi:hypothetical protein